jgi:acylphosphatase
MSASRAHVYVSGRVQGVGFRYATYDQAVRLKLAGWVRNLADGRVEAVFEGDEDAVRKMVAWCRTGPPGAFVQRIEVEWEPATGELREFGIERSGW